MISDLSGAQGKAALQRLITESIKVEAFFLSNGIDASASGLLRLEPSGQYCIADPSVLAGAHISFDPRTIAWGKHSDKSSLPELSPPGMLIPTKEFSSALLFKFKDGSLLALFEVGKAN
jgi:hypothetical protein